MKKVRVNVFFWVGSRDKDFSIKFEETSLMLNEMTTKIENSKVRLAVEF